MKWQQGRAAVLGAGLWLLLSPAAQAGWITLTSGSSGSSQSTAVTDLWYDSTSTSSLLAIDVLSGVGTVRATSGGGTTFFSGLGTPVLLDLTDGAAFVSGGDPPAGAIGRGPNGTSDTPLASSAPRAGGSLPADAIRLGIVLTTSDATGARVLTVSVTGGDNTIRGTSSLTIPDGGWWVLGLGSEQAPTPEPGPDPTPVPVPDPSPVPGVPEPTTMALALSGAFLALPLLRRTGRRSAAS